jgi:glycosyltransferase involved in cell wall biosynthesis
VSNATLSIFIPTYRRIEELRQSLDSIITDAIKYNIEIIISSNEVNSEVRELIETYNYAGLRYFENAENLGVDLNMLKVFDYCKSKYCLMLGDDDALIENTLEELLKKMERGNYSAALLNGYFTDNQLTEKKPIFNVSEDLIIESAPKAFEEYWNKLHFGIMVINIEEAKKYDFSPFVGTLHAYAAFPFICSISGELPMTIFSEPTVLIREGVKSYQPEIAKILLVDCPRWLDLMAPFYESEVLRARKVYFSDNFPVSKLMKYLNYKGLRKETFSDVPWAINLKIKIILMIPFLIRNSVVQQLLRIKKRVKGKGASL